MADAETETEAGAGDKPAAPKKARKRASQSSAAAPAPVDASWPRRILAGSATLLLLGLALIGVGPSEIGMVITLLALVALIYGIHTFGRLGPDEGWVS